MIRKTLRVLLPTYVNDTLPPFSRKIVDLWLKWDAPAHAEVQALQHLRKAVQTQPVAVPSGDVWRRIHVEVRTSNGLSSPVRVGVGFWQMWVGGMSLVILSLILLWNFLPPGVVLQWSAQGGAPATFRVYRSVSGQNQDFELVKEIDAHDNITSLNARVYTYRDFLLLPGQEYVYRIEVIDENGVSASQMVMSDAMKVLPGQLTLMLSLLMVV